VIRRRLLILAGVLVGLALLCWLGASLSAAEIVRSRAVHRAFLQQSGYPQGRPGYVADHIFPLCAGGPDAVANLQWQTVADGKTKDRAEKRLCTHIRQLVAAFDKDWIPRP
jgi:hypothetical protein